MRGRQFPVLAIVVLLMAAPGALRAQTSVGTAFTYQGRLLDGGVPADAEYDFEFTLYDDPSAGGVVAGPISKEDEPVDSGLFTVTVDFGSDVFTGDACWLEIGVRPWDETGAYTYLSPRQELTPAPYALALPGLWTQQDAISPNLIGGYSDNSVTTGVRGGTIAGGGNEVELNRVTDYYGAVGGGRDNQAGDHAGSSIDAADATVGGGQANRAGAAHASVGGGRQNTVSGFGGTIGGGMFNTVNSPNGTIGGGGSNTVNSDSGAIGGGSQNTAGNAATVAGGTHNTGSGSWAAVGGGHRNEASGLYATIGGGSQNAALSRGATVPGGENNTALGSCSFAAGRRAQANNPGTFVWADHTDADFASTGEDQFLIRASGGVGINTNSPAADLHVSSTGVDVLRVNSTVPAAGIRFTRNDNPQGMIGYGDLCGGGDPDALTLCSANGIMQFGEPGPGPHLTIREGNVGIGTTTPANKLHVVASEPVAALRVENTAPGGQGIYISSGCCAVLVESTPMNGLYVYDAGEHGVRVDHAGGDGIHVEDADGLAGYFNGDVEVTGLLSKGGGSFKIDHPLDPANKYLYHSFVESPDMMNVYNGSVVLDANGEAVVELPAYFEALNRDFRYQLTAIGAPAPDLYIAQEISDNRFQIAGGQPGTKVSWEVTGIRRDPFANAHRIAVEVAKPADERGKYLHPGAYGLPREMGLHHHDDQDHHARRHAELEPSGQGQGQK